MPLPPWSKSAAAAAGGGGGKGATCRVVFAPAVPVVGIVGGGPMEMDERKFPPKSPEFDSPLKSVRAAAGADGGNVASYRPVFGPAAAMLGIVGGGGVAGPEFSPVF